MTVPFDETMGFRKIQQVDGHAVYEVDVDGRFHNPTGRLHGGLLSGLADAAMGAAFGSLDKGPGTNMDLAMRFLRPFFEGRLVAEARTVQAGRRVSLLACDIKDQEGRLIATAQSQFIVMD